MRSFPLFLLLFLGACGVPDPGGQIKPGLNLFSKDQDIQLGAEAARQVRQEMEVVNDASIQNYVKRIGERLAQTEAARTSGFPFEFTVLNDRSINAFALPGGPMFIFTGLINASETEGELAGVMGHEMAHVILRHGTNQVSKANLLQLPAAVGGAMAGNSGYGQLAQLGISLGLNSLLLKFSRTAESQSDILGARMIAEAGYNPIEMARFFEKLEAEGGSRGPEFFASHPNPGNRKARIEQEIRVMPQKVYDYSAGGFDDLKDRVSRLPEPRKKPQQQQVAAPSLDTAASAQFRQVQGPSYTVAMPQNWELVQARNSASAAIAPRGGLVRDLSGNIAVGAGVLLGFYTPQQARNLNGASNELWSQMRQANPTIQLAGQARRVMVDGRQGLMAPYAARSPFGGEERGLLVTVARPEGLFYMVASAPAQSNQELGATLQQVLRSLRFTR